MKITRIFIILYGVVCVIASVYLLLSLQSAPEVTSEVMVTPNILSQRLGNYHKNNEANRSNNVKETVNVIHNNTVIPNFYKPPVIGKQWPNELCKDFIGSSHQLKTTVCPRITCYGSSYSKRSGTCTLKGVAVMPQRLYNYLRQINIKGSTSSQDIVMNSQSTWLVADEGYQSCHMPSFDKVNDFLEPLDYARSFVKLASLSTPLSSCDQWIRGVTFFYIGMEDHIYFKFLGWHNLYRTLLTYDTLTNYTIVRLPEGYNPFLFPEFEKKLFPNVVRLQDFKDDVVCFEDLVLVPWAYGAPAFRCRIEKMLKRKCLECDGRTIDSDYKSFRKSVLSACDLEENIDRKLKKILVIERKQYNRHIGDKAKSFTRVWINSKDLINNLSQKFPHYNVTGIYAEELTLCQQIRHAHDADILIGMHGAGMVHVWWAKNDSTTIEIKPMSQRGNIAFKTLAAVLGHTYKEFTKVTEKKTDKTVTVNVMEMVQLVGSL